MASSVVQRMEHQRQLMVMMSKVVSRLQISDLSLKMKIRHVQVGNKVLSK